MLTTILVNFNNAMYLPESLASLLEQVRRPDELIIIDDESTDNSIEVISSFLPRHPNARLVRNAKNQGCNASLNDGLKNACGVFIHFSAADDLFYPTLYERGIPMLQTHQD